VGDASRAKAGLDKLQTQTATATQQLRDWLDQQRKRPPE